MSAPTKTETKNNPTTPERMLNTIRYGESTTRTLDGPKYHITQINTHTSTNRPCFEVRNGKINSSITKQNVTNAIIAPKR
ncbi:MAG: hypothetical protein AAB501_03115 [Patescibacteria group bacterium]